MVDKRGWKRLEKKDNSKFKNSFLDFQNIVINTFKKSFYEENKIFIGNKY